MRTEMAPQMPARDDFPVHVRDDAKMEQVAQAATTKRKGLLERLASVGLGVRREEEKPAAKQQREPEMQRREPESAKPAGNVHPLQPAIDPSLAPPVELRQARPQNKTFDTGGSDSSALFHV